MPDIFLSYTREDADIIPPIRQALAEAGLSVWAGDEIEMGSKLSETFTEIISEVEAAVAILTPNAKHSKWVYQEITSITYYKKPVFPVLARGDYDDSVPTQLLNTQIIDLRDDFEDGLEHLIAALNEALALDQRTEETVSPRRALVLAKEAQELLLNGRYFEALKLAKQALKIDPENPLALEVSAAANLGRGNLPHALKDTAQALDVDPDNVYIFSLRAEVFLKLGEMDQAKRNAKKALDLDSKHTDALRILAEIELSDGDVEDALEHAQQILEIEPYNGYALRTLAEGSLAKGDFDEALGHAQKALDLEPENEAARRIRRMAQRKKGD